MAAAAWFAWLLLLLRLLLAGRSRPLLNARTLPASKSSPARCSAPIKDGAALKLGLVEGVVPADQLLSAAKQLALDIAGALSFGRRAGSQPGRHSAAMSRRSTADCRPAHDCQLSLPSPNPAVNCLPSAEGRRPRVETLYRTDKLEGFEEALALLGFARKQVGCGGRAACRGLWMYALHALGHSVTDLQSSRLAVCTAHHLPPPSSLCVPRAAGRQAGAQPDAPAAVPGRHPVRRGARRPRGAHQGWLEARRERGSGCTAQRWRRSPATASPAISPALGTIAAAGERVLCGGGGARHAQGARPHLLRAALDQEGQGCAPLLCSQFPAPFAVLLVCLLSLCLCAASSKLLVRSADPFLLCGRRDRRRPAPAPHPARGRAGRGADGQRHRHRLLPGGCGRAAQRGQPALPGRESSSPSLVCCAVLVGRWLSTTADTDTCQNILPCLLLLLSACRPAWAASRPTWRAASKRGA